MFDRRKKRILGTVSSSTDQIINETIEKQQKIKKTWANRRPKTLAVSNPKRRIFKPSVIFKDDSRRGFIKSYWFPLLCIAAVISVAIWTFFPTKITKTAPTVPEPVMKTIDPEQTSSLNVKNEKVKIDLGPLFDIVRIGADGSIVIAGRFSPNKSISVLINGKTRSTIMTNHDGEFVYAPKNKLKPGNYTVELVSGHTRSDKVFLYIDEKFDQSVSLLITKNGSRVLQAPKSISKGTLTVNKIDYVSNKRLIVQGKAIPKLRVSVSLNGKLIGMTRVSSYKNFGLGATVGELKAGKKYVLSIKLHDSMGKVISQVKHSFVMPKMVNTAFYAVKRGDCLWIIARNFFGKGIMFSVIATANDIKNPDLIYPNQKFKIPVKQ